MNKEEFLKELREKISILNKSEVDDIINEYNEHIEEELKNGKKEEQIIKKIGNIDEIATEILDAYKIDKDYNKKNTGQKFFDECQNVIDKLIDIFTHKSFNEIVKFIIEIIVIIILIAIMKIPFLLIESIGENIFTLSYAPVGDVIKTIWSVLIQLSYIVVAVILFVTLFKRRYLTDEEEKKYTQKKTKKTSKNETKKVPVKKRDGISATSNIVFSFFKVIIILLAIPFLFSLIGLCVALGLTVYIGINYMFFVGIFLCLIALIVGNGWLLDIIYRVICDKDFKGVRILLTLIAVIVLFTIGVFISTFEFSKVRYLESNSSFYNTKQLVKTIDLKPLSITEIDTDEYNVGGHSPELVYDDNLNNKVRIEATYYPSTQRVEVRNYNSTTYRVDYVDERTDMIDGFFNNLKKDRIADYSNMNDKKVIIYINKKDLDKINLDDGDYYLNGVLQNDSD